MKHYCLFFCLLIITSVNIYAGIQKEFYVSTLGNDNNPGTLKLPFSSIAKARDVVRTMNKNMNGDIVIYLRGGKYELSSTFTLSSDDAGTNGHSVIYQAYHNERPIISGGKKVKEWKLYDPVKNIYMAKVDTSLNTRQIYVNGIRAIRARSRDASGWYENGDGYVCPREVELWGNVTNVEVVSFKEWKCHRGHIASVNNHHVTMAQPYWRYLHYQYDAPPVWIENAFELLDTCGEWYFNRKKGVMYYIPRGNESMQHAEVIMPVLETLISCDRVNNIQFIGITFSYATWLFPNSDHGFPCDQADLIDPWQIPTENRQMPGNICFKYCQNVRIENCHFTHLGASGLQFFTGCKNNEIINNVFDDISGSAISVGNLKDRKPLPRDLVLDNRIENNLITHIAEEYKGCVGILIGYTEHTVVTHNELRHLPYSGISVGWGYDSSVIAGRNNDISYNLIDSILMELRDGGGIYTLSSQPGARVHHNFINHQFNTSGALYPDVGTSDMRWDHNVVMNSTTRWVHLWHPRSRNDTIENNYFDNRLQTLKSTNSVGENNVFISNANLPDEAKSIIVGAGRIPNTQKKKVSNN